MSNENLRSALQHAGLQPDDLAQIIEVDVKTVRRWLSGMAPYPRHRGKVARALDTTENELRPKLATAPPNRPPAALTSDLLAAYPTTNDPAAPDWQALMRDATDRIDLLDETLLHILETDGVPDLLADKAGDSCEIRILIADPDSPWVSAGEGAQRRVEVELDDEEREGHNQREADASREVWQDANQRALDLLRPLMGRHGVEVHGYVSSRFNSILRVDEQMLVSLHLWAQSTPEAPLLHLQRNSADGLFDRFAEHYDALWQDASLPLKPHPDTDQEQAPGEPTRHDEPPAEPEPDIDRPHQPATPPLSETPPDPARPRRWPRRPSSDFTGR